VRVVAFRHVPFEGLGHIQKALEERGITIEFADLYQVGSEAPETETAAGLIFMGGPMSVNDGLPYLEQEIEYIRRAAHNGQPVLGVCLGAQLAAKAMGARIYRNPATEIGWFDIHPTNAAREDSLFHGFSDSETVFHWHNETFDLPPDAELLASSERCLHQAFRVGSHIYGLQFHLEVTPEMIDDWCRQDANCGDVRELDSLPDPCHNAARLLELSRQVFGAWVNLLASVTG
jgi:GMP synthase-like glutamine amidotransferase